MISIKINDIRALLRLKDFPSLTILNRKFCDRYFELFTG